MRTVPPRFWFALAPILAAWACAPEEPPPFVIYAFTSTSEDGIEDDAVLYPEQPERANCRRKGPSGTERRTTSYPRELFDEVLLLVEDPAARESYDADDEASREFTGTDYPLTSTPPSMVVLYPSANYWYFFLSPELPLSEETQALIEAGEELFDWCWENGRPL